LWFNHNIKVNKTAVILAQEEQVYFFRQINAPEIKLLLKSADTPGEFIRQIF